MVRHPHPVPVRPQYEEYPSYHQPEILRCACGAVGTGGNDFARLRIIGLQIRDGSLHLIRTLNGQIQHTFLFAVHRFPAASDSVNLDTHLIQLISHGTRDVGANLQIIKLSLNLVDRALIQAQRNTNALGFCCSGDLLSNPLSLRLNTSFVQSYTNLDAAFGIDQLCNIGKLRRNTLCRSLFICSAETGNGHIGEGSSDHEQ